jgi:hypothetical protein
MVLGPGTHIRVLAAGVTYASGGALVTSPRRCARLRPAAQSPTANLGNWPSRFQSPSPRISQFPETPKLGALKIACHEKKFLPPHAHTPELVFRSLQPHAQAGDRSHEPISGGSKKPCLPKVGAKSVFYRLGKACSQLRHQADYRYTD